MVGGCPRLEEKLIEQPSFLNCLATNDLTTEPTESTEEEEGGGDRHDSLFSVVSVFSVVNAFRDRLLNKLLEEPGANVGLPRERRLGRYHAERESEGLGLRLQESIEDIYIGRNLSGLTYSVMGIYLRHASRRHHC